MTEDQARAAVENLRPIVKRRDFESAHGAEDALYVEFAHECARRCDRIGRLARIILETQEILTTRYYG